MMKKFLFLFLFLCVNASANAQDNITSQINTPLLQKYVDLAIAYYPKRQMYLATERSAKAKIGVATAGYLEAFNVSYFYRPDNQAIIDTSNPYSINGFQFGAYLNLGVLLRTPSLIKQAKEDYKAATYQTKEYEIILASQVRQVYYEYLQLFTDVKLKAQAYTDNKVASDGLRYKFEKGEVSLDVYSKSKAITSASNTEKLLAEVNMLRAKDTLEALIGQKLEEVK